MTSRSRSRHCGLCYSDIHLIDDDWKKSQLPAGPRPRGRRSCRCGAAPRSRTSTVGQRVGVGWQRSACLACELCVGGHENLCPHAAGDLRRPPRWARAAHDRGRSLRLRDPRRARQRGGGAAAVRRRHRVLADAPLRHQRHEQGRRDRHRWARSHGDRHPEGDGCRDRRVLVVAGQATRRRCAWARITTSARPTSGRSASSAAGSICIISTVHARLDWIAYLQALRPNGVLCLLGGGTGLVSGLAASAARAAFDHDRRHREPCRDRRDARARGAPRDRARDRDRADARRRRCRSTACAPTRCATAAVLENR